jgi:hypothetical protein
VTDWPTIGLTAALVVITGYYAWQNKRTADQNTRMVEELRLQRAEMRQQLAEMRRQTQLGFYRPRLAVLRGVRRALGYVARDGMVPGETLSELLRATAEKEFLFGPDLCDYLDGLYRKCVHAYTLHLKLEDLRVGEQRTRIVNEEHELLAWILEQPVALREKFKPYLQVEAPGQEATT